MSKLIESLKAGAKEFSKKQEPENGGLQDKKTNYQMTQEQLADIYFSGSEKAKKSEYPMVIKVVEKQRAASLLPWFIASIAFLITALSLFSTKRIFVDIKVIDDRYLASMQNPADEAPGETSGEKIPLQNFTFEGASKLKSSRSSKSLTLVNSSVAPFARASLRLETPLDLSNSKIVFYAKGSEGGENLSFAVKDRGNILAFAKGTVNPFPQGLTTEWQRAEIPLLEVEKGFDPRNVSSLRFEFGAKDTKNKPGDTVFVRDLQVVSS